jgi:glycosyltransferase involved in cell wall biosynthesis
MRPQWPSPAPAVVSSEELPPQPDPGRIKLLHVITRFAGGSGGNTLLSATGMSSDRYEVWVAGAGGGPLWARAECAGVRTVELKHMRERIAPLHDAITLWQLVRLIRRERFSIVHTHCAKAGLLGRVAARLTRTPVVVHTFHALPVHEFMSGLRRACYLAMDRAVRGLAHQYVAVAPRLARQAVEARIVPAGSIAVVPSGVDIPKLPPTESEAVRQELGIPPCAPVVGTVGRVVLQKAPLDFVRMAALVRMSHPGTVFVMVGDASLESAPLEDATRAEALRLGVDVIFTGFRPDAQRVAAAFDVFVISSLHEGLGRALTEAMALGRPVVATAVNGVPDLVEPGSTGLLAPPGRPDDLAQCVTWMLDHPDAARRMGRQGAERVRAIFDPRSMCALLDDLYRRWLGLPDMTGIPQSLTITLPVATESGNGRYSETMTASP